MNIVFVLVSLLGVTLNLYSRNDGVVAEFIGDGKLTPQISASEFAVSVNMSDSIQHSDSYSLPLWIEYISFDSTGVVFVFSDRIASVDWALSRDSMSLVLHAIAFEAVQLPSVVWQAPPLRPDTALWSDSLVFSALERGEGSPWLANFDCIVLDPGHGGRDPGAVGPSGSFEKDRTLEIVLMVRDLLRIRMPELSVVLTRKNDEYVSLGSRTRMANRNRADLFVSIHCNAAVNASANGFETYFLSRARTDDARAVEILENNVIELDDEQFVVPDDPLSFLLADMAQSIFQNQSSYLAGSVQNSFSGSFPVRRDRGVKRAGFYVLRGAYMPAVLIEVGFISNPEEEQELKTLDFRFKVAQAIVESIIEYSGREN